MAPLRTITWIAPGLLALVACGAAASRTDAKSAEEPSSMGSPEPISDCGDLGSCAAACEQGDASSCEWLGHMHETGEGAPQDFAEAARYYDKACTQGRDQACAQLAMMYDIGLAVEEDPERAAELYERACKAGNSWACNREDELR